MTNPRSVSRRYLSVAVVAVTVLIAVIVVGRHGEDPHPHPHVQLELLAAPSFAEEAAPEPISYDPTRPETDRSNREHPVGWMDDHAVQALERANHCATCHRPKFCTSCHEGNVPENHKRPKFITNHKEVGRNNAKCMECHTTTFCDSCHLSAMPGSHDAMWMTVHGRADRNSCVVCHKQENYCAECHRTTEPRSHQDAAWHSKHGGASSHTDANCITCHTQNYCNDCHGGIPMPHPDGYMMGHKDAEGVSLEPDSACFKCHEQKYCEMCH